MDKKKTSTSTLASIFAGGLAGASETIVTYPAEFVKTRRQLEVSARGHKSVSSLAILKSTIYKDGFQSMYSGCQTLAISNAAKSGIRFFSFEFAQRSLRPFSKQKTASNGNSKTSPLLNVSAGLCAGIAESILVVTPGESLKTRVIHDAASGGQLGKMSLPQIISQVVRQNGMLSLWKGLTPVLCKQGTNSAVRFATFNTVRDGLRERWPEHMRGTTATLLAGAGSGVVTVYASMPFDNIKTRMQAIGSQHRSMFSCAVNMATQEGIKVFWKATTPRLVRLTLSSSITFMVYDFAVTTINVLKDGPSQLEAQTV